MRKLLVISLGLGLFVFFFIGVDYADWSRWRRAFIRVPHEYPSIQEAIDAAKPGATILVSPGYWEGATVNKPVKIRGVGQAIICSGPQPHPFTRAGFYFAPDGSGSGATISNFIFEGTPQYDYVDDGQLDFAIFSRGADNVTVRCCIMKNTLQGITNWNGSGWKIILNKIEGLWVLCGGGIGILLGSFNGTPANNNFVWLNNITADVSPDCAFYTTAGIVLYSSTRWGSAGGPVEKNIISCNRSKVTGTWLGEPAGVGFEITDGGILYEYPFNGDGIPDVVNNKIKFNDFRGSSIAINLDPEEAKDNNMFYKNLGSKGDV